MFSSIAKALVCMLIVSSSAQARTVELRAHDVASNKGTLQFQLCSEATFLKKCPYRASTPAQVGDVVVRFENIPPGSWSADVFHDENGNKKLDKNFFGVPSEGWAMSRNAKGRFGPPAFADAAVQVKDGVTVIDLYLSY